MQEDMNKKILYFLAPELILLSIAFFYFFGFKQNDVKDFDWVAGGNLAVLHITGPEISAPIKDWQDRILHPFSNFISPGNAPFENTRFTGFHTAVDFEVFEKEKEQEVDIFAFCSGQLVQKKYASGYGGLAVQQCSVEGRDYMVVYGHMDLLSINWKQGDRIDKGDKIGVLGQGFTQETDGERKHLHFGIHKGKEIDIRGYVKTKEELEGWVNPVDLLK